MAMMPESPSASAGRTGGEESPAPGEASAPAADLEERLARLEQERDELARALDQLENRLLTIEHSRFFRLLRWPGRAAVDWRGRLAYALTGTFPRERRSDAAAYAAWVAREQGALPPPEWFAARQAQFRFRPLFSVVMKGESQKATLESVEAQNYSGREVVRCEGTGAEAGNRAAASARGDYLVFLEPGDLLAPSALHYAAEALQRSAADFLYADEDRIDAAGCRRDPVFKPAWSPDLLLGTMYAGGFAVIRRDRFLQAGGFRSGYPGAELYDLLLRLSDAPLEVRHIPRVFCHRGGDARSAIPANRAAAVAGLAPGASLEDGPSAGTWRVVRPSGNAGRASVIVCSRNEGLARRCLASIERRTAYRNREILLVEHGLDLHVRDFRGERIRYDGPFHFARMNNLAAARATGEWLLFLNDDVVPLRPDWMDRLAAHVCRPEVGAVGALLLYPSGSIQHAFVATGMAGGAGHPLRDTFGSPYWPWWRLARDVSAVTGACLAMRTAVFRELGGFDERFPVNGNDVDLCLRARRAGYRVIVEPAAVLRHDEARTRAPGLRSIERIVWNRAWPGLKPGGDPFYNPNLSLAREDAGLNSDPPPCEDNSR
jgi:GT2 family glycosyltransferase